MKLLCLCLLVASVTNVYANNITKRAGNNDAQRSLSYLVNSLSRGEETKPRYIEQYIYDKYTVQLNDTDDSEIDNALTNYEPIIPRGSQPKLSNFERDVLTEYLNHPEDVVLAKYLAFFHMKKMNKVKFNLRTKGLTGRSLRHAIIGQYFIERAIELGETDRWLRSVRKFNQSRIERTMTKTSGVDTSEGFSAQSYFLDSFNNHEENRYKAIEKLLNYFVKHSNNVMASHLVMAANLWIGGEADYDDPTTLYNYIVGAYFSLHTMTLSEEAEKEWLDNPVEKERFRMASIVGGFSITMRRWIAELHGDEDSITLLDQEHQQWVEINPIFHMFTYGLTLFEDNETFDSALSVYRPAFIDCGTIYAGVEFRTCVDRPRFSFNALGMTLLYVDFFLKEGDINSAQGYLLAKYAPYLEFDNWTLGQEAWLHREQNAFEIMELYRNDDPEDDPLPFMLKKRKWSANTQTCQSCHQVQNREWSEEEKNTIQGHPEEILTIGTWPEISTSWYGSKRGL